MGGEVKKEAPAPEGGAVKGPGGYLVKDFADGWYWTPNAALDHASGAPVWSVADGRYETDPSALATREEARAVAWKFRHVGQRLVGVTMHIKEAELKAASGWDVEPLGLITHPAPDALRVVMRAAGFLLDRLRDLEWDVNERDFNGHVLPAASRLRQALDALQAEPDSKS